VHSLSAETWTWVKSFSSAYPGLNKAQGTIKNHDWHGSGHQDSEASASTSAFIVFSAALLVISVFYMMYRVYRRKSYFSNDWRKEFGSNSENLWG